MARTDGGDVKIALAISIGIAMAAFALGPAPAIFLNIYLFVGIGLLPSLALTVAWFVSFGWMLVRFGRSGLVSLLGAPLALAFPAYLVLLIHSCSTGGSCL